MKKISLLVFICFIVFISGLTSASSAPACENYSITLTKTQDSTGCIWTYEVCYNSTPSVSHWSLGSCICSDYLDHQDPVQACENAGTLLGYGTSLSGMTLYYQNLSSLGTTGFKFNEFDWDYDPPSCETFWIKTNSCSGELVNVAIKAGDGGGGTCYKEVYGPAHETIEVPEFGSLTALAVILLTAPGFAYIISRRK